MKAKKVIFIRHCESVNNEAITTILAFIQELINFRLPSSVLPLFELLKYTYDCAITTKGNAQVVDICKILKDDSFWELNKPQLIIHSPLIRARETVRQFLINSPSPFNDLRVASSPDLREANILEHIFQSYIDTRIKAFEGWLGGLEEETVIVVGHGKCITHSSILNLLYSYLVYFIILLYRCIFSSYAQIFRPNLQLRCDYSAS